MYVITLSTIATLTHNTTPITMRTILTMQHPTITTKIIAVQTQILEDAADIEDNLGVIGQKVLLLMPMELVKY